MPPPAPVQVAVTPNPAATSVVSGENSDQPMFPAVITPAPNDSGEPGF